METVSKILVLIVILAIVATLVQSPHTVPALNSLGKNFSGAINAAQSGKR